MAVSMPEISADRKSYTFTLRDDLLFADDGTIPENMRKVTTQDVKFSILRIADARNHSPVYWIYRNRIAGLTAFRQKNGGRLPASAENELKRLMDKYLKRYGIENVTYESVISDALSIIDSAAIIEHIRWNAYMRSEGFVYAKKKNVPFKAHYNLVNLSALSISDKVKDI